jgi:hypothetical protein
MAMGVEAVDGKRPEAAKGQVFPAPVGEGQGLPKNPPLPEKVL